MILDRSIRTSIGWTLLGLLVAALLAAPATAEDWDVATRRWKQEVERYLKALADRDVAQAEQDKAQGTIDKATTIADGKGTIHMAQGELDRLKAIISESAAIVRAREAAMSESVDAALAALRGFDSKDAVKAVATLTGVVEEADLVYRACAMVEEMGGRKSLDEMRSQLGSTRHTLLARALCRALWRSGDSEDRAAVMKALSDKDENKRIGALDAIPLAESGEAFDRALELLESPTWQVRVAALGLLSRSIGMENEEQIVRACIARMGKEEGRVRADLHEFLKKRMNGASGGDDPERWAQLWDNFKHDRESGALESGEATVTTYYGIPIYSKHVVFILDTSGSMAEPHNIVREIKPQRPEAVETEDGSSGRGEKKKTEKKRKELDWASIKTKIELAKAELIRTLEELDEDVNFSIVTYNTNFNVLSEQLVPATAANKKKFIDQISGLQAGGSTCAFFTAQFAGMECYAKGGKGKPTARGQTDLRVQTANTLYFLTDGFPTVNGGGPGGNMPEDVKEKNLQELQRRFETTKVVINTVGIGPHDTGLLRRISDMTGGTYVDLSR